MPAYKDAKDLENIKVNGISLNKLMLCLSNIKKKMNIFAIVNLSLIICPGRLTLLIMKKKKPKDV